MTAGGEALDLALGLLRSPAHRRVLQGRPLPDGMTELLEVASGSVAAQRSAAGRMRASPGHLQEAARFFVQQVLFTDRSDAYRILGADAGAADSLLRRHHRLLLRWLHPDHNPGALAWETTFAHRVNQAWNQVRTPVLRRSYDDMLATTVVGPRSRPVGARLPAAGVTSLSDVDEPGSRLAPWLVLLLGLLCLLLAWLAVRGDRWVDHRDPPATVQRAIAPTAVGAPAVETTAAPVSREQTDPDQPGRRVASLSPTHASPPLAPLSIAPILDDYATARPLESNATNPQQPDDIEAGARLDVTLEALPLIAYVEPAATLENVVVADEPEMVPPDPLQLLREADAAVAHLAKYLASPEVAPPSWRGPEVERSARELRTALEARVTGIHQAELSLDTPNWLLGSDVATLNTAYQLEHAGSTLETGLMQVRLERGLDGWQVATVQLEPAR
ncbi:hypothetical protein EGK76_13375 [Luteimonas sp. 100069]|nr:hypothetical protein EGK76_13375 [Luteimonas sp. 100069]